MYTSTQKAFKQYSDIDFIRFNKKAVQASMDLKQKEQELIKALQQVWLSKTYMYFKYKSLFDYAMKQLELTESQAYSYTAVAKKSLHCEELNLAIKTGSLTVSKAHRIVSIVDEANQREWVQKAQQLTKRELEKQISKKYPRKSVPDHFRVLTEDLVHMQATIEEKTFKKLQRAQELLNQKQGYKNKPIKTNEVLSWALDELLERQDPVRKAQRVLAKQKKKQFKLEATNKLNGKNTKVLPQINTKIEKIKEVEQVKEVEQEQEKTEQDSKALKSRQESESLTKTNTNSNCSQGPQQAKSKNCARAQLGALKRKALPSEIFYKVILRDHGRCQFKVRRDEICGSSQYLHIHHKRPKALGGGDHMENLVAVCSAHHRYLHRKE
ncbi:MAG: HNH endonuclease [Bdellovibrionales bacterium]|nr:HNH endonuclease [Bdellovibrionales bacterium]